jgi:hypothetical protein
MTRARNKALLRASGDIIAFPDDDRYVRPCWAPNLAAAFEDPTVAGGAGRTCNSPAGEEHRGQDAVGLLLANGKLTGNFAANTGTRSPSITGSARICRSGERCLQSLAASATTSWALVPHEKKTPTFFSAYVHSGAARSLPRPRWLIMSAHPTYLVGGLIGVTRFGADVTTPYSWPEAAHLGRRNSANGLSSVSAKSRTRMAIVELLADRRASSSDSWRFLPDFRRARAKLAFDGGATGLLDDPCIVASSRGPTKLCRRHGRSALCRHQDYAGWRGTHRGLPEDHVHVAH